METGPILRALARNKIGAVLIALQIAITMTVVVNAYVMIDERVRNAQRLSGVVEDELFHIESRGFSRDFNGKVSVEDDLALLRQVPGVVDAVVINAVPLSGSGWSMELSLEPGDDVQVYNVALYMVDDHGVDTLGVELIAGRNFTPGEIRYRPPGIARWPDKTIISEATARRLWPDDSPLEVVGRTVYINNDEPMTVVGVIARLQAPWSRASFLEQSVLLPDKLVGKTALYMIRTEPGRREAMMPVVEEALAQSNLQRIVQAPESMAETRKDSYALDSGLASVLGMIMVLLVAITTLGIVGLASFSVRRRTRQIGTRRALGATRGDIMRYFVVENVLITSIGVTLGAVLTVGFNVVLVDALGIPKLNWVYVPLGMAGLLLVGILAALGPAHRASSILPAIATRTV